MPTTAALTTATSAAAAACEVADRNLLRIKGGSICCATVYAASSPAARAETAPKA